MTLIAKILVLKVTYNCAITETKKKSTQGEKSGFKKETVIFSLPSPNLLTDP